MEVRKLGNFTYDIAKIIAQIIDAKLNFLQECTVPKDEQMSESEMTILMSKGTIYLRTAEQTQNMDTVKFKLFDTSFPYDKYRSIPSYVVGLSETALKPTCSSEENKTERILFRCKIYRELLMPFVLARCAQECVIVDVASFTIDDFNGYTNLIGVLEKAFMHINSYLIGSTTNSLLAEVFLNTRNFLIITNSLLNPNEDNIATIVGPYLKMFLRFLDVYSKDPELLPNVLVALQVVMNMVLLFFGVIYTWVFLASPDGRLEGGIIGLSLALAGGVVHDLCPVKLLATSLVGLISGNLIGGGGYDSYREQRYMQMQQKIIQEHQELMFTHIEGNEAL
jgi:hypothetical protein